MSKKPATVDEYLAALPPERRAVLAAVRAVILANLDGDYAEGLQYGMIGYYVPHSVYPAGYHCDPRQPLPFACLGATKSHLALHLMCVYGDPTLAAWFQAAWKKTGKKLDMGKACLRFRKLEDVALDVIAAVLRKVPARTYIKRYEALLNRPKEKAAPRTRTARSAKARDARSAATRRKR